MQNIGCLIEIKRGLHKVCGRVLVNVIADLEKCEDFFQDIFHIYGLKYDKETLIQKETFITAIAKYFILDRLPEGSLELIEGKYENDNKKELKKLLPSTIDTFYTIYNNCDNKEDLPKKYAEYFNEEVRDFSKEIAENRDDSLSDFAKAIMKVYNNSKSQKQ